MRRVMAVCLVAIVVAGCSSKGGVDGPVLTSPASSDGGGMDALIVGALVLKPESGCLLLVGAEGAGLPVVWPAGTSWQDDPAGVILADGQLVELGMSVRGGGGFVSRDFIERKAGSEVADAAAACAGPTGEIALFNLGSSVTPEL